MIKGLGIDAVEIERIREVLASYGGRARRRLFTDAEQEYCEDQSRPEVSYAARFAAKEAFSKALGTGMAEGLGWKDVEVERTASGCPRLKLSDNARARMRDLGAEHAHVSLTHTAATAVAVVVLEG